MAVTPSTMLELGTKAPDFSLPGVNGKMHSLAEFKDHKALLVMFICNHCPFVKHIQDELGKLGAEYQRKGVGVVAISSNDADKYKDDAPDKLKQQAHAHGFTFPYLFDGDQSVAKAYRAACTPDFYVFDKDLKLVYRGQLDDSRPGNGVPVTGQDLRAALDLAIAGDNPSQDQKPSIGCNIKWKPGNEPDYFNA